MQLSRFKSWRLRAFYAVVAVLALAPMGVKAQRLALKTNALDYVILEPNLAFEARLSRTVSIQLGVGACPVTKSLGDMKFTNFKIEPELRYWFNRPMARHFMALSLGAYDYSLRWKDTYFNGDAVSAGLSYGYALVLGKHWNMEAEVGVGIATVQAKKYHEGEPMPRNCNYSKVVPVPVRLALNFSYIFE